MCVTCEWWVLLSLVKGEFRSLLGQTIKLSLQQQCQQQCHLGKKKFCCHVNYTLSFLHIPAKHQTQSSEWPKNKNISLRGLRHRTVDIQYVLATSFYAILYVRIMRLFTLDKHIAVQNNPLRKGKSKIHI